MVDFVLSLNRSFGSQPFGHPPDTDYSQTPSRPPQEGHQISSIQGHSFLQRLGVGYSFLLLVTGENKVNSYSVQLKFSWECNSEWSLTKSTQLKCQKFYFSNGPDDVGRWQRATFKFLLFFFLQGTSIGLVRTSHALLSLVDTNLVQYTCMYTSH